ncbi:MAG TPA: glycosyltransferase [Burkholderiaceae bacterium]|nr:glycosyltransferase [Burkholderiaceae bacterium]
MDLTIIVCTYNRAPSLRDTLEALRRLESPPGCEWEVIVVDNNSRDETRAVVEELATTWPRLRYAFERAQGLSHARNHGIAAARGEVILFTDDDVLPESDWLRVTLEGLERHGADACGGYIAPIWERPPPSWLTERFFGFLALRTDRSDDFPIVDSDHVPFGANMAFRRRVFERVGVFDTKRGRNGKVLAGGEDIEFFERLMAAGMKAWFLGRSRVHHKVEAYRLRKGYFLRWRFHASRNIAMHSEPPGSRRLFNIPFYMYPQFFRSLACSLHARLFMDEGEALHRDMLVCHFLGTFQGLWTQRRHAIRNDGR